MKSESEAPKSIMPRVPAAAVMSFLKDTRGLLTWTVRDLADMIDVNAADASKIITIMAMQGYIKPTNDGDDFFTTPEGHTVSGSKLPNLTRQRVEKALVDLKGRIAASRKDFKSPFKIKTAVAFGDFLGDQARVQAPDVGIALVKVQPDGRLRLSASENAARWAFLKQLRGRNVPLNLRLYEEWMGKRSHQKLL